MLRALIVCAAIALALSSEMVAAQGYRIDWYSINSGGGSVAGGSYAMSSSVGQSAAGLVENTSYIHWVGFWSGDAGTPIPCNSVADAKAYPDGTLVSVADKVATSAGGDFAGFFYVEEPDRSSGIRVALAPGGVVGLARGSLVNIIGTLGTESSGERQIIAWTVVVVSTAAPLTPVGLTGKSLGGGDLGIPPLGQVGVTGGYGLNNIGLLVTTWGQISYSGSNVLVDDGSGVVVKIDTSTLTAPPADGSLVGVTGISSLWKPVSVRLRLVLPRTDEDMVAQ